MEMEVDRQTSEAPVALQSGFAFEVLQLIKSAQAQHGLRRNDYTRYRQYCTHRLRRLYKALKFTHGRGKYMKKSLLPSVVTDVRYLHIALYSAERAWSQAMELKDMLQGRGGQRRYHLLRRLRKSCKWADLLESLCNDKADSKTALEATAYASYLRASLLLETGEDWSFALKKFTNTRIIYEELGKFGDVDHQMLCKQRVEEIEPSIRHCHFKLSEANAAAADDENEGGLNAEAEEEPQPEPGLQEKLQLITAEAEARQEISATTVKWLRHNFPVHNTRTRASVLKVQQLEADLQKASLTPERRLVILEKIVAGFQEARKNVREELASASEDMRETLVGLDKSISCLIFAKTIERAELQFTTSKNRLSKGEANLSIFQELVTLCDSLDTNITELADLATSGREKHDEEDSYAKSLFIKQLFYRGERCFYLGQAYLASLKHAEAFALFNRGRKHGEEALELTTSSASEQLQELITRCRTQSALAHARGVMEKMMERSNVVNGVSSLSLDQKDVYLMDQLDEYKSALAPAGGAREAHRICQVPPAFRPVACRPIFLDTALDAIEFPSLEARLKEKKKGLFGKWW